MYIDGETIVHLAELLGALAVVVGGILSVYKIIDQIRIQGRQIKCIMAELAIIDAGLRGALAGLVEQGCNGQCKEALHALDRHLNAQAHGGTSNEDQ